MACSSLLLAAFKICWYTFRLTSVSISDGLILQTPYLPHPPARRSTVALCARLAWFVRNESAPDARLIIRDAQRICLLQLLMSHSSKEEESPSTAYPASAVKESPRVPQDVLGVAGQGKFVSPTVRLSRGLGIAATGILGGNPRSYWRSNSAAGAASTEPTKHYIVQRSPEPPQRDEDAFAVRARVDMQW